MSNYAVGIVAHYTRQHMVYKLTETIAPDCISVDQGDLGANANHLHVWDHLAHQNTTWSITLEDDAKPIPDFYPQLEAVLDAAPAPIISLYLGRQRPPQHQEAIQEALEKADANDAHWILATQLFHAVAVAIRTELIPNMLRNMHNYLPIDENIGQWARRYHHPIAYTVPSLVDHADGPTLIQHPDQAPRPAGRKAWRIGSHHTWNTTTVEL